MTKVEAEFTIERSFAALLKATEPQKVRGGSPKRRAWLRLVLNTAVALGALGYNVEQFQNEVLK